VAAGELDAAIVHGDDVRADLRSLPLPPDRVVAVVSQQHPLAERSRNAVDDLVSYPLIFAENALGSYLTRAVLRACRSAGFDAAVATVGAETGAVSAVRARPDSWSVFYAAQAALLRADELGVRFVPVVPALTVPTALVFRADAERVGRQLVRALREK
jgi:DNA-binding transcriptional LysR family regulator